jgi:hypothetical protein
VITTQSDPPENLLEVTEARTKSTLKISWQDPAFTGGADIISYRVQIAEEGQAYSIIESGINYKEYLATGLSFGTTYQFAVAIRTSYGYSSLSTPLLLLCASVPEAPATVTTSNQGS